MPTRRPERLKELQVDVDWPMYGIPDVLHLDNASEFYSEALRRGLDQWDPVRSPLSLLRRQVGAAREAVLFRRVRRPVFPLDAI